MSWELTLFNQNLGIFPGWSMALYFPKGISPRAGQMQRIVLGLLSILKSIAGVKS